MAPSITFKYPNARRDETVDEQFGRKIADPYRYLENPNDKETIKFIEQQNEITEPYLKDEDGAVWNNINGKLTKLWNYPKYTCASKRGSRYFYSHNSGLQNQNVVYYQNSLSSSEEPKVFLNPNELSDDGTVSLQYMVFSQDGSILTYGLSESGSDWVKIKFRDVETNKDFPETLLHSKFFRPAFTHDNVGIFYGRFNPSGLADGSETEANENQKVYYHRIGEEQDKDVLVAEFPENKNWRFSAEVSDCGNYLIFYVMTGCNDQLLYFSDLRKSPKIDKLLEFEKVVTVFEADYDYITNEGSIFYFLTNKSAPNFRIIAINFDDYAESNWKTVITEHEKNVLDWACCVDKDKIVCHYMEDVKSMLAVCSLHTGELQFKFNLEHGAIQGFFGRKNCSEIFYHFVSFLNPGTVFHYDFKKSNTEPEIFKEVKIENFNKDLYKVEQVFYKSIDGTQIPMFIVRKNEEVIKPKPLLLYGYGGFNIPIQPTFSITLLSFVDIFDGALSFANIRGGSEYGRKWHDAGRLLNKQNVFDDFQQAARFLVEKNYTTKDKLAIQGGSNGGLLVGACINQQPNLFQAAIAQVGVFDMMRFHRFTIGSAWCSDYGSPDEELHFKNLIKYSPLHNTKTPTCPEDEYPATLILTGDHDDRVSPLHSLKFAATLQYDIKDSTYQKNPIFLRVYTKAGHGQGKPIAKKIEEATDILVFLYKNLKVEKKLL